MAKTPLFDRKLQHEQKRQAIVMAAAKLFHQYGYDGTSLDKIADELGITKRALYRYVENKQQILYLIFCQWLDVQRAAVEEALAHSDDHTEIIRHYTRIYVGRVLTELVPMDRIVGELNSLEEDQIAEISSGRDACDRRGREIFEDGARRGTLTDFESRYQVHILNGAIDWIFKWYRRDGPLSPEEAADKISEGLLIGFAARP